MSFLAGHSMWLLLLLLAPIAFIQNMAFTASSRSRNSGDPSYHRKAAWASNGIYILTHFTILSLVYLTLFKSHNLALLVSTAIVYILATTEGSVQMMKIMLARDKGKRKISQFTPEEADRIRTQMLTPDSFGGVGNIAILLHFVDTFKAQQASLNESLRVAQEMESQNAAPSKA